MREEVTEEEIADIVSRWTGIPVTRLMEGERKNCCTSMNIYTSAFIGQNDAVNLVTDADLSVREPASKTRTGRSVRSFFLARPGLVKPNWQRLLLNHCLTPKKIWCASI